MTKYHTRVRRMMRRTSRRSFRRALKTGRLHRVPYAYRRYEYRTWLYSWRKWHLYRYRRRYFLTSIILIILLIIIIIIALN